MKTSIINEYTSNVFLQGNIHDNLTNTDNKSELFAKMYTYIRSNSYNYE